MPRLQHSRTALAAVAALLLGAISAQAQEDDGLFSVTPSMQIVVDRPPVDMDTATVRNTTESPLDVRVFPVLLGQDVSGAYTFSEAPRDLNAAAKIVAAGPDSFEMPPGSATRVRLRWGLLPTDTRAAFVGVIYESKAQPAAGQQVKTIQRLLTVNFLRLPGPYRSSGRFTRLRATQGGERTLLFYPRIENTGEFVTKPTRGKFRIRDAKGEIVFQTRWNGDVVLPGFQRDFPIEMRKVLQAGDYAAVATADFGDSTGLKIIERFRLVGPNQLPTPEVAIEEFRGEGVLGGDSRVTGRIESIGTAPATTAVRLELFRLSETRQQPEKPIQSKKLEFDDPIAPGESTDLELVYPDLPAGDYRVIGTYRAGEGVIKRVSTDFSPQKDRSAWQKFKDWLDDQKGILIGLGVLLLIALLVWFFLRRQGSLQRQLDEARGADGVAAPTGVDAEAAVPEPATPAPVEMAAPPPAGVDINTAGLTELQALPGVGPKAAERIIAHREEYGAFASVDELAGVEGFGAKRVEAIRAQARV